MSTLLPIDDLHRHLTLLPETLFQTGQAHGPAHGPAMSRPILRAQWHVGEDGRPACRWAAVTPPTSHAAR
ncbi:hypothetical protein [Granulibacter bethesdensis]|uniref:hypothetical protein n=1 Tax=Granulibacter bethesdensis TaxID=364410 RepID=UPI000AA1E9DC|nr:hypothetical protein [Granulibacter bethesdensis]